MRRPLSVVCVVGIVIIVLYTYFSGVPNVIDTSLFECGELKQTGNIRLKGQVVKKEIKNDKQIIYLKRIAFSDPNFPKLKSNIGIMCYLEEEEMPHLGSFVILSGKPGSFDNARNPGCFDMKKYYASIGYFMPIYKCHIEGASTTYSKYQESLYMLRQYMSDIYDQIFNESDASVIKAVILGEKSSMDPDIKSLYQRSGISHLLSISGLHISIFGVILCDFFKRINAHKIIQIVVPMFVIVNYCVLTGMGTGAVRAGCMFIIMLMGIRRTYDTVTALSVTAFGFCIVNRFVIYSSGFWLSFLAVFGIAVFSKCLVLTDDQNLLENKKHIRTINNIITGIAITIFTLPLVLFSYYECSLYSVILNLLLAPLMVIVLSCGALAGMAGVINIKAGIILGYPCDLVLRIYEIACRVVQKLPAGNMVIGRPHIIKIIIFYMLCVVIIFIYNKAFEWHLYENKKSPWWMDIKIRYVILALSLLLFVPIKTGMSITFLDVGQGDGICIEYDGLVCMIDGGSSDQSDISKYTLLPFLKSKGITKIDYWIITHPDMDHYSGLLEILCDENNEQVLKIKNVLLPDTKTIKEDGEQIISACHDNHINILFLSRGDGINYKHMKLKEIHPDKLCDYADNNGYSQVLLLEYGSRRCLFTGDATLESEQQYIKYANINNMDISNIDIYKVAHHGSTTSSGDELVQLLNPEYSMISSGRKNRYGHPDKQIVDRLQNINSTIYNTQNTGAVIVHINRQGKMKIKAMHE